MGRMREMAGLGEWSQEGGGGKMSSHFQGRCAFEMSASPAVVRSRVYAVEPCWLSLPA